MEAENEKKENSEEEDELEKLFKETPLNEDTTCGYWIFTGPWFQRLASKKAFILCYGLVGTFFASTYAYFNGTITSLEKRYKIPSRNTGIISVGSDITPIFVSPILSYYAGKSHQPRWLAAGISTVVAFCFLSALPHFLYGPGEEALALTEEFGAKRDPNQTLDVFERERRKELCQLNGTMGDCEPTDGNLAPQVILFGGQVFSGIGHSLYYSLGAAYIDDNIVKSKTPALISTSYFLRLLGPAIGYTLVSYCLEMYIQPNLTPVIDNNDPRWIGAWWIGWIAHAIVLGMITFCISLFPRSLPRAHVRRLLEQKNQKSEEHEEKAASFSDMLTTFKRIFHNKTFICNVTASIFYFFGAMPYWILTPKYIETQYKQSASVSSLVTGTVALVFSAIGVLSSGFVISRYKPSARMMAGWNVFIGAVAVAGTIGYVFLGCAANEKAIVSIRAGLEANCSAACHCDYVKYSPVCGENDLTYISACHAGCGRKDDDGQAIYSECLCIPPSESTKKPLNQTWEPPTLGTARPSACPINCSREFFLFVVVMCLLNFSGATGRATNFLVSVRCVDKRDKATAMGFAAMLLSVFGLIPSPIFFGWLLDRTCLFWGKTCSSKGNCWLYDNEVLKCVDGKDKAAALGIAEMLICFFALIPSPIFFGWLLDQTCLIWGKTCSSKGNCWLYDNEILRVWLNLLAAGFTLLGTLFDAGVWYYVKDLKIFDDDDETTDGKKSLELIPLDRRFSVASGVASGLASRRQSLFGHLTNE